MCTCVCVQEIVSLARRSPSRPRGATETWLRVWLVPSSCTHCDLEQSALPALTVPVAHGWKQQFPDPSHAPSGSHGSASSSVPAHRLLLGQSASTGWGWGFSQGSGGQSPGATVSAGPRSLTLGTALPCLSQPLVAPGRPGLVAATLASQPVSSRGRLPCVSVPSRGILLPMGAQSWWTRATQ